MPPEWHRHQATWLTWPHSEPTWPGCLDEARAAFAEMIRIVGQGERVELLVQDLDSRIAAEAFLLRRNVDLGPVRFHTIKTNDSWIRDYGPTYVLNGALNGAGISGEVVACCWRFNAWGGKYPPWDDDDRAGDLCGQLSGCRQNHIDVVLEGGSIDIDEQGCLLTTRHNVFEPNRGAGRGENLFDTLCNPLGLTDMIMLNAGIVGDDTDGHVDDITRFTPHGTIVTAIEPDFGDANHDPLAENLEILERETRRTGHHVVELPMPEPLEANGSRLPASYANFYIANAAVLVPTFNQRGDAQALKIIGELFDDRPVAPIDARTLVVGLGSCHCLTNQQPALGR